MFLAAIREKIVLNASPLDLKKDEGGLAEIEFTVRLLQLRYAAGHPELKRGDVIGIQYLPRTGPRKPRLYRVGRLRIGSARGSIDVDGNPADGLRTGVENFI